MGDITPSLHPRFMAEEVCSYALKRNLMRRRNSHMHAAWGALEMALNLQNDPGTAEDFFDFAEARFEDIQRQSGKTLLIINARLGTIFMPAYKARYMGETLSSRTLAGIHTDIAAILGSFDDQYDPKGQDKYAGVKPELVTLALFARLRTFKWLAYPASPREENTDLTDFNHDSYVLRGGLKVPIQVKRKSGSGYDDTVAVVRYSGIMDRVNAVRQTRPTQVWGNKRKASAAMQPFHYDDFSRLLVREAKGEWLSEHEDWLLDLGSMAAILEVMEAERIIRGESPPQRDFAPSLAA